jgi:hypothetical protein
MKTKNSKMIEIQTLGTSINNKIDLANTNYEIANEQVQQDKANILQRY